MQNDDVTIGDVLEAVNKGFTGVQKEIEGLKTGMGGLKTDVVGLKAELSNMTSRVTKVEATMVTKSYLDDKLADVNGKIAVLTDVLHRNGTITDAQRGAVRAA